MADWHGSVLVKVTWDIWCIVPKQLSGRLLDILIFLNELHNLYFNA
jgi:hypothetical protein